LLNFGPQLPWEGVKINDLAVGEMQQRHQIQHDNTSGHRERFLGVKRTL